MYRWQSFPLVCGIPIEDGQLWPKHPGVLIVYNQHKKINYVISYPILVGVYCSEYFSKSLLSQKFECRIII
jgi:hypothetical protein